MEEGKVVPKSSPPYLQNLSLSTQYGPAYDDEGNNECWVIVYAGKREEIKLSDLMFVLVCEGWHMNTDSSSQFCLTGTKLNKILHYFLI